MELFEDLKRQFTAVASKNNGVIRESDYHRICANVTDADVLLLVSGWLLSSEFNLFADQRDQYRRDVQKNLKNPSVERLKKMLPKDKKPGGTPQKIAQAVDTLDADIDSLLSDLNGLLDSSTGVKPTNPNPNAPAPTTGPDMWDEYRSQELEDAKQRVINDLKKHLTARVGPAELGKIVQKAENATDINTLYEVRDVMYSYGVPISASEDVDLVKDIKEYLEEVLSNELFAADEELVSAYTKAAADNDTDFLVELFQELSDYAEEVLSKQAQSFREYKFELERALDANQLKLGDRYKELKRLLERADSASEVNAIWDELTNYGLYASNKEASKTKYNDKTAEFEYESAVKRKVVFDNDKVVLVDVAEKDYQKAAGLEVVDILPRGHGMLFTFERSGSQTFHMGGVKFPIDIMFLKETPLGYRVAKIVHNASPGDVDFWSCDDTSAVLEINGGEAKSLGLKVGSLCEIKNHKSVEVKNA